MKSARRSLKPSAQVFQRRIPGTPFSAEHPGGKSGKAATKRARQAADLERVLHMSQQLYAHALTLQEVIRSEGQVTYEALRPRFDRQAAQQFELLYPSKRHSKALARSAACE
jgi:hypothetical protein